MVKFTTDAEPWTVYRLQDGSEVRIRVILVAVNRREGEHAPDGSPMYDFNMQQIMHVDCPEHLKLRPADHPPRRMDA